MQQVHVSEGVVRVDSVDLMLDRDDVKVWHINLNSKYAVLASYSDDGVIMLDADTDTLRTNPTAAVTVVSLPPLGDEWSLISACARYTCRVVAYRLPSSD